MSLAEDFQAQYRPVLDDLELPARISGVYEPVSCLGLREDGRQVWLLRRREDGAPFVLKLSGPGGEDLEEEFRLLRALQGVLGGRAPVPADCFAAGGKRYLVRAWVEGETLAHRREREGACPEAFCVEVGRALCALLARLHAMDPPVIHRDIKPENIVLGGDGGVCLIDFGIARRYEPGKAGDTRFMGSDATAAPEQYGFSQTDRRTDLYALGRTLCWMVTGSYGPQGLEGAAISPRLRRVLKKCTAFDPDDRYQSAEELSAALRGGPGLALRRGLAALLCALALAGAALGALRPWRADPPPPALSAAPSQAPSAAPSQAPLPGDEVAFPSDCLEQVVRAALENWDAPVTYGDLARVERLAIVSERTFPPEQSYDYRVWSYLDGESYHDYTPGDITDISLLACMPNLTELYLCDQRISDLSPLAGLPLTTLALSDNSIEDISVLETLPGLRYIWLGGNPIRDYAPLRAVEWPAYLNLDGVTLPSLDALRDSHVWQLSIMQVKVSDGDWSPLAELPDLHELDTLNLPEAALPTLGRLTGLTRLRLYTYNGGDLTVLKDLAALEDLSLDGLPSLEGIQDLTALRVLGLDGAPLEDLSPLLALPGLEEVWCPAALGARLEALGPQLPFQLHVY